MTNEHNEQAKTSVNPFMAKYQRRKFEAIQLAFETFFIPGRDAMREEARDRILHERITDEAGKIKVYDEVKAQFKEYEEYLRSEGILKLDSVGSTSIATKTVTGIVEPRADVDTEEMRSFEEKLKQLEERAKKSEEKADKLDERLRKLERYTEE
jgi:hypothetical protein